MHILGILTLLANEFFQNSATFTNKKTSTIFKNGTNAEQGESATQVNKMLPVSSKSNAAGIPGKPIFNNKQTFAWKLPIKLSEIIESQAANSNNWEQENKHLKEIDNAINSSDRTRFSILSGIGEQAFTLRPDKIEVDNKRSSVQPATFEVPTRPNFRNRNSTGLQDNENELSFTQSPQNSERPPLLDSFLPQLTRLMNNPQSFNKNGYPQLQSEDIRHNVFLPQTTPRSTTTTSTATKEDKIDLDYLDKVYNQLNKAIKTLSEKQNQEHLNSLAFNGPNRNLFNVGISQLKGDNLVGGKKYIESGYKRLKNKVKEKVLRRPTGSPLKTSNLNEINQDYSSQHTDDTYSDLIKDLFGQNIPRDNDFQKSMLRNALLRQRNKQSISGVGIKSPNAVDIWGSKPSGFILPDRNVPSDLSSNKAKLNQRPNTYGMANSFRNPGFPMKTGVSRLKLPPVISSTFSVNPIVEIPEEIPSITSLGPVNIPSALRRYGNLNKLAEFQNVDTRNRVAETEMNRISSIINDRMPLRRQQNTEILYNSNNRISFPLSQKETAPNRLQSNVNRINGKRSPPTMYPVYNSGYDHIRGVFVPSKKPDASNYHYYYGNNPRSSYKRFVDSELKNSDTINKSDSSIKLGGNQQKGKTLSSMSHKKEEPLTILPPQYIPPPNRNITLASAKREIRTNDVDQKRSFLNRLLIHYYKRKSNSTSKRRKRSLAKMLKPPAAWLKYYSNTTTSTERPNAYKKEPVSVQPNLYSSYNMDMEYNYQQMMMMNYNNQTISNSEEPVGISEELDAIESTLLSIKPPDKTELVIPTSQTTSTTVILTKPEAIKKAEITASQIQEFNPDSIQSLVAQASILGQATVNNLSVSSNISINKLLIAAILSLIPTIAIAIPFLAPNLTRRNRRRRRYFRLH